MTISLEATVTAPSRPRPLRRQLSMVAHQVRFDLLALARNRSAQGFVFAMPITFLVLFVAIFGNGTMVVDGQSVRGSTYYVAALTVFAVVDTAFMALVVTLVERRETGVLRRRRATPQPAWTILAGQATTTLLVSICSAVLLLAVGRVAYRASLDPRTLPALLFSIALGALAFSCLGFAVAGLVRSFDSAQPVAMGLALPLMFISGVFIPWGLVPHWLQHVSEAFPVRALAVAVLDPYLAHGSRSAWSAESLLVLCAWGTVAIVVAVHRFEWAARQG